MPAEVVDKTKTRHLESNTAMNNIIPFYDE